MGALFEFINIKKKAARLYNLIYALRRMIYIVLIIFANYSGALVLLINMYINLIYVFYIASVKAFKKRSLNKQDSFNEFIVSASNYCKILYTDVV